MKDAYLVIQCRIVAGVFLAHSHYFSGPVQLHDIFRGNLRMWILSPRPKSIPAHSVHLRLEKIVPGFSKAQREVCDFLALLRNQELHTSDLACVNLKESRWLPRYYEACKLRSVSRSSSSAI